MSDPKLPEEDVPTTVGPDAEYDPLAHDLPTTVEDALPEDDMPTTAHLDDDLPTSVVAEEDLPTSLEVAQTHAGAMDQTIDEHEELPDLHAIGLPSDVSSEATMVHDVEENPIAHVARLLVLEGIHKGKEYNLLGIEISFGREKDNTISYQDLSVSRHHFKIHYKDDRYFELEDLGSSGGTLINNEMVEGSQRLEHGDTIQVGKNLLRFEMTDELVEATRRFPLWVVAVGFGALFLMAWLVTSFMTPPAKPRTPPPPAVVKCPADTPAKQQIKAGGAFLDDRAWLKAKGCFEKATQLAKTGCFEKLQAKNLLERAIKEISIEVLVRRAKVHYEQGQIEKAHQSIQKADQLLTPMSMQADDVWSWDFRIRLRRRGGSIQAEYKKAKALVQKKQYAEALKILNNLSKAVDIDSPQGKKVIALINEARKAYVKVLVRFRWRKARKLHRAKQYQKAHAQLLLLGNLLTKNHRLQPRFGKLLAAVKKKLPKKASKQPKEPTQTEPKPKPAKPKKLLVGSLFFNRGQLVKAQSAFEANGKEKKANQVKEFRQYYGQGATAFRMRNPDVAIPKLRKAYTLERALRDKKSVYTLPIQRMLVGMFYFKGRQGMSLRTHGGYRMAFIQFSNVLRYDATHRPSKKALRELRNMARGWLTRAEAIGKNNEARGLLRNVQRVVAKNDTLYKKAAQLLKKQ